MRQCNERFISTTFRSTVTFCWRSIIPPSGPRAQSAEPAAFSPFPSVPGSAGILPAPGQVWGRNVNVVETPKITDGISVPAFYPELPICSGPNRCRYKRERCNSGSPGGSHGRFHKVYRRIFPRHGCWPPSTAIRSGQKQDRQPCYQPQEIPNHPTRYVSAFRRLSPVAPEPWLCNSWTEGATAWWC